MPLSEEGKNIRKNFHEQYGVDKGEEVFYSFLNEHPEIKKKVEGTWEFDPQLVAEASAIEKLYKVAMDISRKDFIKNMEREAKTDAKAVISDQEALLKLKDKFKQGHKVFSDEATMIAEDFIETQHKDKIASLQDAEIMENAKGAYVITFVKELFDQVSGEAEKNPSVESTGEKSIPGMTPAPAYDVAPKTV